MSLWDKMQRKVMNPLLRWRVVKQDRLWWAYAPGCATGSHDRESFWSRQDCSCNYYYHWELAMIWAQTETPVAGNVAINE